MSNRRLMEMLEEVEIEKDKREQAKLDADFEKARALTAAGDALASRLLPRLSEAQETWHPRVKLVIIDKASGFRATVNSIASPQVEVTVTATRAVSYAFVTPAAPHVHVVNLANNDKGNKVEGFKFSKIDDLTDENIDQVLQEMLRIAHGLKEQK